jgi:hypothetical protein
LIEAKEIEKGRANSIKKPKRKKYVTTRQLLIELELGNSTLLNEQLYKHLKTVKENKKLQRQIHERTSWKGYIC